MHYDLKLANILTQGAEVNFVDFEFARFRSHRNAYAPETAAFCADFNVSINAFFPARSNVANFEFRALHHYLDRSLDHDGGGPSQADICSSTGCAANPVITRKWLLFWRGCGKHPSQTSPSRAAFRPRGRMDYWARRQNRRPCSQACSRNPMRQWSG